MNAGVKFGRAYSLNVGLKDGGNLNVQLPFTLDFDIVRNTLSSANTAKISVLNLSKTNRNGIRKNVISPQDNRPVELQAGYGLNVPTVFLGNISRAYSVRRGPDFQSHIEAYDAGLAYVSGHSELSFPSGTNRADIVHALVQDLPGVSLGAVGNSIQGSIPKGNTYSGTTVDILREFTGGGLFIDNGRAYVLADNEALSPQGVSVINSGSGLLGTPIWEEWIMHFDMIFEPKLRIGQLITLESSTDPTLNGSYKIVELHHRGTISAAICREAITTVGLMAVQLGAAFTVIPELN